jgi:hypothetical protein
MTLPGWPNATPVVREIQQEIAERAFCEHRRPNVYSQRKVGVCKLRILNNYLLAPMRSRHDHKRVWRNDIVGRRSLADSRPDDQGNEYASHQDCPGHYADRIGHTHDVIPSPRCSEIPATRFPRWGEISCSAGDGHVLIEPPSRIVPGPAWRRRRRRGWAQVNSHPPALAPIEWPNLP